jgi:hypothetical protein
LADAAAGAGDKSNFSFQTKEIHDVQKNTIES